MTLFKCKMCGGSLEIADNQSTATCEYCGTQQTLPKLDDGRRANLYDRANHFRRNNEFDKAMNIYEQILNEDKSDAEAYWSLVLCRFGIEYVEDPSSRKRVPTVNRAQFTSIFDDDNYKSALLYADGYQKSLYEEEAKAINEIQRGILAISQKEDSFDVFICYKETDNNGRRTPDSVLANDLYHQLTQEGFKVFFARITLEDKLGSAYEPYIFAALNSAKVMVVLGTKPEYFNAVWVKNEWSRYLALIKNGEKKILIPAYKDMDPYDLPEEFSHLQAQDMSKLGFMQDLIRGIKKIAQADTPKETVVKETFISSGAANTASLLRRAFMFLEDGDWNSADEYCEKVLDIEPENAQAYLGKLLSNLRVKNQEALKDQAKPFNNNNNFKKAVRFADDKLKVSLVGYIEYINTRNELARLNSVYIRANNTMAAANTESAYKEAAHLFESISEYQDSLSLAKECYTKAKDCVYAQAKIAMAAANTESAYKKAAHLFESIGEYQDSLFLAKACYEKAEKSRIDEVLAKGRRILSGVVVSISDYEAAIKLYESISGWKDADERITDCKRKIEELKEKEEASRLEQKRQLELKRIEFKKKARRNKKIATIATIIGCAIIVFVVLLNSVIIPNVKYNNAIKLMNNESYSEAISAFKALDGYKDSVDKIEECNKGIKYNNAIALMDAEKYIDAKTRFTALNGYKDSAVKVDECNAAILDSKYDNAIELMNDGKYKEAITAFEALDGYKDSAAQIEACYSFLDSKYDEAVALMGSDVVKAYEGLIALEGYKDSAEKASSIYNEYTLKTADVGDEVIFGTYEQDNIASNGKEDIEWLVLAREDNRLLVISKYGLDCKPYNETFVEVTWETSSMRKWLNNTFINNAFTAEEKAMIPTTNVSADKNPKKTTSPGNDTQDKVFILSIVEAEKYFGTDAARTCAPTDYAIVQGVYAWSGDEYRSNGRATSRWWLRSPGYREDYAAFVSVDGSFYESGVRVNANDCGVRPALWINVGE